MEAIRRLGLGLLNDHSGDSSGRSANIRANSLVQGAGDVDAGTVAECIFTSTERKRIDSIAFELSDAVEDFLGDARESLSIEEWDILSGYVMASIRRVLEVGPLLHAVVDKQEGALPYPGRGREAFVRAALLAWRDSFAPIKEVWRLAPILEKVEGGERRVLADIAALEVMAANRMFTSLDDQCAELLTESRE